MQRGHLGGYAALENGERKTENGTRGKRATGEAERGGSGFVRQF